MHKSNKTFIEVLSAALKGNKINLSQLELSNFNDIFHYAWNHNVESLVFSGLNYDVKDNEFNELYEKMKKITFISAVFQIKQINKISLVLNEISKHNVNVIALKGLQVMQMYNNPEFRTMSDIDILAKDEDLNKIDEILTKLGYKKGEAISNHVVYNKEKTLPIEVHWAIKNKTNNKYLNNIAEEAWENTKKFRVGDQTILGLSDEYLLLYLIIHIKAHLTENGFGVRQLCDIYELIDKKYSEIDWQSFKKLVDRYDMYNFSCKIFYLCNKLFEMRIIEPFEIQDINNVMLSDLINQIIDWGTYGDRKYDGNVDKLAFYNQEQNGGKLSYFINILFPKAEKLNKKYNYALKYKILIPIAWVHRWINIIFSENIRLISFINNGKEIYKETEKKVNLTKWLNS